MMPNNRDIVHSIRREKAAEFADTLVDVETMINLAPACTWDRHDTGETGCEPGAPGEFVVRVREHCGPVRPVVVIICEAQWIRLRGAQHVPYECVCGRMTTPAEVIDFFGRVEEYYA